MELASVSLRSLVHHQHDLRTVLGSEALPGTRRLKPVNQVFERLERIVRGNGVEDRPCPLHLGHGMIGLASPEQLHHAPLRLVPFRTKNRLRPVRIPVLASGLEPPTY